MKKRRRTKLIHEGKLMETDDEWSPYLSVEDVYKLDDVREALRRGDVRAAIQHGRVFTLTPVTL